MKDESTQAEELEWLCSKEVRSRNFLDLVQFREYLEQYGKTVETRRTGATVYAEKGLGFITRAVMKDGSVWENSKFYLNDDHDKITFEKRPLQKSDSVKIS